MPFDLSKSNTNPTSSSKTTESSQIKTARSAPLRMPLVIEPGNVKETISAPTIRGRVIPMLSGGESTTPKMVPSGNQYLTKNA
jgi:hypothetical protein